MAPGKATKKAAPKGGIKKGSAVKVMKAALGEHERLSVNAVDVSIRETQTCIERIAKACKDALDYGKRKTLTHTILLQVLEKSCARRDLLAAAKTAQSDSKLKGGRNMIANASVGRIVKRVLGKDFRLSATALDAFSLIAEAELRRFAESGSAISKASGRKTLKERDIIAVIKVNNC